jgi:lipopolysaccharide transport system permease protein
MSTGHIARFAQTTRHFPPPMIDPHANPPTSLTSLIRSLWRHRELISQMTRREVVGRYRGSVMGLAWSFFNPILMLVVYTFVFSVVFKARWGTGGEESQTTFAIVLFVGMIVYGLFAEMANRAPGLILSNVNYVKKVIFPLEILPVVGLGAALFHALISLGVLLAAILLIKGSLVWTVIFFPLILIPLLIATLGVAWFLASIGVFARDVGQTISIFTTVLMFTSPVFFPVSSIPEKYQVWLMLNPLTFAIEQSRAVMIFGKQPSWVGLGIYAGASLVVAWAGYWWFQKTRKGFADVL